MKKISVTPRRERISEILENCQHVSVFGLASMFGVCEMTIRRDLDKLESAGRVRRTHGGAVAAERMMFEFDFAARRKRHHKEKRAIAKEALKIIRPNQSLLLDTGTTVLELACLLRELDGVTVISPSLAIASVLQFTPSIQTVLLGGILREGSATLTGPLTEKNLEMFTVDIAFQGIDGLGIRSRIPDF